MKKIFIVILLINAYQVKSQTPAWQLCNTDSVNYFNHCFIESGGFVLSTGGISNDSGYTWLPGTGKSAYSFGKNSAGIFKGTDSAIYFSGNNGLSWTNVYTTGVLNFVFGFAVLNDTVFAATRYSGVLMSPDNGLSWTAVNSGLPNDSVFSILEKGNLLFAGMYANGLYRSSNAGASWTPVNSGLPPGAYCNTATDGIKIYASTGTALFLSSDDGASWTQASIPSTHLRKIINAGNAMLVGGYTITGGAGIYRSLDSGITWSPFDNGLPDTCIYTVGALYATSTHVICGMDEPQCPYLNIYRLDVNTVTAGINDHHADNKNCCKVFPDPFTDELYFKVNNTLASEVNIYDITGRKQFQQRFSGEIKLNTSSLEKGIYLYEIIGKYGLMEQGKILKN